MAIVTEQINDNLTKTYSDNGVKIHGGSPEGDYDSAIDPTAAGRSYMETSIPVTDSEATAEDYLAALAELGVTEDEEG